MSFRTRALKGALVWFYPFAVLFLSTGLCFAEGRKASDTVKIARGLSSQTTGQALLNSWFSITPDATEVLTHDAVGAGAATMSKQAGKAAENLEKLREAIQKQPTGKMSEGLRKIRERLLNQSKNAIGDLKDEAKWFDKFGTALEVINIVSVGAKAAGYAAEGDFDGAAGAAVDEIAKKVTTGLGMILTTPAGPAGPIVGAALGEEFHDKVTRRAIESNVSELRTQHAKDRMLNSGIPETQIMTNYGTKTLPPEMYVDSETGLVKRRTPEQQKAYRELIGQDIQDARASDHPLSVAQREFEAGKITEAEFNRRVNEYNKPTRSTDEYEKYKIKKSRIQTKIEKMLPPKPMPGIPKDAERVLERVIPAKMTASTVTEADLGTWAQENIVNFKITIQFWNLGSYAPGYDKATMTVTSAFSVGGKEETHTFEGTFSGGPEGRFEFYTGDEKIRCQLHNGTTISIPDSPPASVSNPEAFKEWPK